MICPDREALVHEYVDGTLPARDRVLVEEHLALCAGCRAAVAELRGLVARARTLPPSIEPTRDLWGGIASRLRRRQEGGGGGGHGAWWRERTFWGTGLAAAATLAIAFGISRLGEPGSRASRQGWVAVAAGYEQAAGELSRMLAAERGRLRPETIAVVERNLAIIDAAIRESRAALAHDPANVELRQLFAAAYRQKVELLRWASRVATAG
jgi:anti-sigma-K factor RskA